jgi:hypothetical protein
MKKSFAFYFVIASVALLSCNKEVTELPPSTQTGANTFGCKVDGKFWVPAGFGIMPTAATVEVRFLGTDILINARNFSSSPTETEFELRIKNVTGPGVYSLNTTTTYPNNAVSYGYYVHRKITPDNEWMTSAEYPGTVTITKIDTVNLIVSGTFEFQAINLYNNPQPMSVTEGRFDVKME